jgi:hypothetical protein
MTDLSTSPAADIAELLEIEGIGIIGDTIFIGHIPQKVNKACIGVYDAGGGVSLPTYQRDEMFIRFNIISDVESYQSGYNLANSVKEAVIGHKPININSKDYIIFTLLGDINHLGRDELNRNRFSLNLRTIREQFGNSPNRQPFN